MDLKGILSISGKPGLFKMISQTKSGLIVESLIDSKRYPTFLTTKLIALEDVSIYGEDEDKPLSEIYQNIYDKETGGKAIDVKTADNKAIEKYFCEIYPEYHKERVFVSDMKKALNWYNSLQEASLLKPTVKEAAAEEVKEDK